MFFKDKFSVGFIFVYAHLYFLKYFPTFPCYEYYVATWIFGFKDMSVPSATCFTIVWCIITSWISISVTSLTYLSIKTAIFQKLTFILSILFKLFYTFLFSKLHVSKKSAKIWRFQMIVVKLSSLNLPEKKTKCNRFFPLPLVILMLFIEYEKC